MGMSASQARFLALTARKNNVEFEGQQINQQRTTLSNQSASYYAELCNMVVPTPPSIDNYTKVSYTFNDGAMTNTITSMIAQKNNKYKVSYVKQWQDDYSVVAAASSIVAQDGTAYKIGNTRLRKLGENFTNTGEANAGLNKNDPYISQLIEEGGNEKFAELKELEKDYQNMLNTTYGKTGDVWYVRYVKDATTGNFVPYFYKASEVEKANAYDDNGYSKENINCYTLGSSTKTEEVLNQEATVVKDSSGRYVSIKFDDGPEYTLTTNTMTDEEAYNDAMNQYNYAQYQYDQKVQSINSKIEIIQQQDKSLELELKQLDTEESAISTEMEAVKKVISKNVDSTFKTFSA